MPAVYDVSEVWVMEPGNREASDIKIDPEFQSFVPAISDDERTQLEANIVQHGGARDPLTVWLRGDNDEVLLDGHNRYEICTRLGLRFSYCHVFFETRDEAADWIDRNQLGRRNLSRQDYKLLLGRRYNRAKRADGGHGDQKSGGQTARPKPAAETLAKEHGVDEKTVRRAGKLQAAAAQLDIEQKMVTGAIKASEADIVEAADALPDNPTAYDIKQARDKVKASGRKRPKSKQADKPTAGESRRKNGQQADKITRAVIALRTAVELLARTDSAYRDQALAELQRLVSALSRIEPTSPEKPDKRLPDNELRAAVAERWEKMRLWEKHWSVADMKDVRRLFIELIRDEQKQMDK